MRALTSFAGPGHQSCDFISKRVQLGRVDACTYLDHISRNEPNTPLPTLRGVVKDIVNTEVLMICRKLIQVLLEEDILLVNIGKEEVDLSLVLGILRDSADNLEHRRDSGSSGDHGEGARHVWRVHELSLGPAALDGLPDLHVRHEFGNVASGVRLDQKVEVTAVRIRGDRSVGANDFFAVDGRRQRDVLADGKTENRVGLREVEFVATPTVSNEINSRGNIGETHIATL